MCFAALTATLVAAASAQAQTDFRSTVSEAKRVLAAKSNAELFQSRSDDLHSIGEKADSLYQAFQRALSVVENQDQKGDQRTLKRALSRMISAYEETVERLELREVEFRRPAELSLIYKRTIPQTDSVNHDNSLLIFHRDSAWRVQRSQMYWVLQSLTADAVPINRREIKKSPSFRRLKDFVFEYINALCATPSMHHKKELDWLAIYLEGRSRDFVPDQLEYAQELRHLSRETRIRLNTLVKQSSRVEKFIYYLERFKDACVNFISNLSSDRPRLSLGTSYKPDL